MLCGAGQPGGLCLSQRAVKGTLGVALRKNFPRELRKCHDANGQILSQHGLPWVLIESPIRWAWQTSWRT